MKKVVVIGGGTGNFTVLRGLKQYPVELGAIVSMADDGGSTGILRDELGVLPPGDVRQCLVALSDSSRLMRSLFNYRFENGGLQGHSFGNLLLSALEKVTGNFERAVEEAGKILSIKGKVIPVTTHKTRLKMVLNSGKVLEGEGEIYTSQEINGGYQKIYLEPFPKADPHAVDEIMNADLVVLGPGGLYSTLIPNLLVEGIGESLRNTKAIKVFVANLMNKKGQTTGFKVSDYVREVQQFAGSGSGIAGGIFDYIIVNTGKPAKDLIRRYADEAELVENDLPALPPGNVIAANLLEETMTEYAPADAFARHRTLIRHDARKLAEELMKIVNAL